MLPPNDKTSPTGEAIDKKMDGEKKEVTTISSSPSPVISIWVSNDVLKNYLMLQRRALLQSVSADEKLLRELDNISVRVNGELVSKDDTANKGVSVLQNILSGVITIIRRNTDERRKAFLQIVRDTERRYNINRDKKKYRNKR